MKNKKLLTILMLTTIIFIVVIVFFNQRQTQTAPTYFDIVQQEQEKKDQLYIMSTFPQSNYEGFIHSLNILFSEPIDAKDFTITTNPQINLNAYVIPQDPNRLFLEPDGMWDYTNYEILIKSDKLESDFILKMKVIEPELPELKEVY